MSAQHLPAPRQRGPLDSWSQGGWTSGSASGTTTARVDLCPECDRLRGRWPGCVVGCLVFLTVLAVAAGVLFLVFPEEGERLAEAVRQYLEQLKR